MPWHPVRRRAFGDRSLGGGRVGRRRLPWQSPAPVQSNNSISAAPEGGFVIRMRGDSEIRHVFMPEPFAEWFDSRAEVRRWPDQPAEYTVAIRRAVRELLLVLGRPLREWSFLGVPVDNELGEMLRQPAIYDGQPVHTRGRLERLGRGQNRRH